MEPTYQQLWRKRNPNYQKKWIQQNPEKRREHTKRAEEKKKTNDPLYYVKKIYRERKRTAILKNLPFTITLDDIKNVPAVCPVFGTPMVSGEGFNNPNSATLDKIVPEKGYTPDNVAWISRKANRIKCDASITELQQVCEWLNGRVR